MALPSYQVADYYEMQPSATHEPQQNPRSYRHFTLSPVSGAMGAEIEGIDLGNLTDEVFEELQTALFDHVALMIRDQDLTPEQQVAFAERLGTPMAWPYAKQMDGHPQITELISEPTDTYNFGGSWHSDSCNFERPPSFTMLYCIECPPVGGDTSYANQYLAWDTLPPELQRSLEGLRGVNSADLGFGGHAGTEEVKSHISTPLTYTKETAVGETESVHPIARTHPVTGKKALYCNDSFTLRFDGMTQEESLPLLRYLWKHAITPEFTCRFRWKPGSFAIWDNRACQHYAHNDYRGRRREMRRIVVEGERPF